MSQSNQRRIVAETRQSVHVHYRQCQTAQFVFKVRLKVLRSSADRHLYDSEFQIEGALTVNAFAFLHKVKVKYCLLIDIMYYLKIISVISKLFFAITQCSSRKVLVLEDLRGPIYKSLSLFSDFKSCPCPRSLSP